MHIIVLLSIYFTLAQHTVLGSIFWQLLDGKKWPIPPPPPGCMAALQVPLYSSHSTVPSFINWSGAGHPGEGKVGWPHDSFLLRMLHPTPAKVLWSAFAHQVAWEGSSQEAGLLRAPQTCPMAFSTFRHISWSGEGMLAALWYFCCIIPAMSLKKEKLEWYGRMIGKLSRTHNCLSFKSAKWQNGIAQNAEGIGSDLITSPPITSGLALVSLSVGHTRVMQPSGCPKLDHPALVYTKDNPITFHPYLSSNWIHILNGYPSSNVTNLIWVVLGHPYVVHSCKNIYLTRAVSTMA